MMVTLDNRKWVFSDIRRIIEGKMCWDAYVDKNDETGGVG